MIEKAAARRREIFEAHYSGGETFARIGWLFSISAGRAAELCQREAREVCGAFLRRAASWQRERSAQLLALGLDELEARETAADEWARMVRRAASAAGGPAGLARELSLPRGMGKNAVETTSVRPLRLAGSTFSPEPQIAAFSLQVWEV